MCIDLTEVSFSSTFPELLVCAVVMSHKRRLLILSCSQRKHETLEPLPAIERYNGPLFFVLRRYLRECPRQASQLDVYILSAAYGLIPGDFPTACYDQKINTSRVAELQPQVNTTFSDIQRDNYASICFALGRTYLKAFEGVQILGPNQKEPIVIYGTMGKRQVQLKKWLWGQQSRNCPERNSDESGSH